MPDHVAVAVAVGDIGGPKLESQQVKVIRGLQHCYLLPKGRTSGPSRLDELDPAETLALCIALLMPAHAVLNPGQITSIMRALGTNDFFFGDILLSLLQSGHARQVEIYWYADRFHRDQYVCILNGDFYGEPADVPILNGLKLGTEAIKVLSQLVKI